MKLYVQKFLLHINTYKCVNVCKYKSVHVYIYIYAYLYMCCTTCMSFLYDLVKIMSMKQIKHFQTVLFTCFITYVLKLTEYMALHSLYFIYLFSSE